MATATKHVETVETVTGVTLELTTDEARTLAVVLAKVGGPDGTFNAESPRRHSESVFDALRDVGIDYRDAPEYHLIADMEHYQGLYFEHYPEAVA